MLKTETVRFKGWENNIRLSNGSVDLIITADVGPRILRCGFTGERNLMAEFKEQLGGTGEKEWMIRGGHRLWFAPEVKPDTYELDNIPVKVSRIDGGIRTLQEPGPVTGIQKRMDIVMADRKNEITITHVLTNRGRKPRTLAPWALTVMAPGANCIIPLPPKIPHTGRLTHNQEWSLWGYTDFADGRWTLGSRFVFFRQDRRRGPAKLGVAHREGWVACQIDEFALVKRFDWIEGATYPDGGVNFETFSNERMLEVETLAPMATLKPGQSVKHTEIWQLIRGLKPIRTEKDADALARRIRR